MHVEDDETTPGGRATPVPHWRKAARTFARRAGFVMLIGLAFTGAWSIYAWLTDPIRLATLAVDDGSAEKALAVHLAKQRVCAPVLDGPEPFTTYSASSATLPSVRALQAAGLIEPVPAAKLPPERPQFSYRMPAPRRRL